MIRVDKFLKEQNLQGKVRMVMNIHDALEFYVDNSIDPVWLAQQMRPVVSFPIKGFPNMRADFHYGPSWGQMTELEITDEPAVVEPDPVEDYKPAPAPLPLPSDEDAGPLTVVIEMTELPFEEEFAEFKKILRANPGEALVVLSLPDGSELPLKGTYGLTPDMSSVIQLTLGSTVTEIIFDPRMADTSSLLTGIEL